MSKVDTLRERPLCSSCCRSEIPRAGWNSAKSRLCQFFPKHCHSMPLMVNELNIR